MRLFTGDRLLGIRWKKGFGGKVVRGTARYRAHFPGTRCTPKLCFGHNGRVKIKLGKVKRCSPYGVWEYTSVVVSFRGRPIAGSANFC